MSQNVTLFQIFGTKLRLPFMFGLASILTGILYNLSSIFLTENVTGVTFGVTFVTFYEI